MVISCLPVCTTVNADQISTTEFPYQVYIPEINEIWISKSKIKQFALAGASNSPLYVRGNDGVQIKITTTYQSNAYWCPEVEYNRTGFKLVYLDNVGWSAYTLARTWRQSYADTYNGYIFEKQGTYLKDYNVTVSSKQNNIEGAKSYSIGSINIDGSLSEEEINNLINESLNSTTQTTTQAQAIQGSLSNDYQEYKNGNLSSQSLQVSVDNSIGTLNSLNNNTGNTLADLLAVNNGLTYAQTVQDKINADEIIATQTVTSTVQLNINGYINQANTAYNDFTSGTKTQSEAIEAIQQQIINLNNIITSGQAQTAADVAAVNAAINTVQNTANSVHNYAELDRTISEKSQQSDNEELNYIGDLQSETTSELQDFAPSKQMNSQQQNEVKDNILSLIWDNELIKMILPLAGACMIICVALGIKYKL